jgi:hypothetical protein
VSGSCDFGDEPSVTSAADLGICIGLQHLHILRHNVVKLTKQ